MMLIVIAISDKPTKMQSLVMSEEDKNEELLNLKQKLDTLQMLPKKKYNYPMTSAQEVGWDMDTEFKTYQPKYKFNKNSCDECKYANDYVTFNNRSPFAAKRPEGAAAAATATATAKK